MSMDKLLTKDAILHNTGITIKERLLLKRLYKAREKRAYRFYNYLLKKIRALQAPGMPLYNKVPYNTLLGFDVSFPCCLPRLQLEDFELLIKKNYPKLYSICGVDLYYLGFIDGNHTYWKFLKCVSYSHAIVEILKNRNYDKFIVKRFDKEVEYGLGHHCHT